MLIYKSQPLKDRLWSAMTSSAISSLSSRVLTISLRVIASRSMHKPSQPSWGATLRRVSQIKTYTCLALKFTTERCTRRSIASCPPPPTHFLLPPITILISLKCWIYICHSVPGVFTVPLVFSNKGLEQTASCGWNRHNSSSESRPKLARKLSRSFRTLCAILGFG